MGNKTGGAAGNLCGPKLRKAREDRHLSLEEAAARLDIELDAEYAVGISPAHLAKIERGEKPVTDRLVWGLSLVYGVDVRDLFPTEEE